MRGEKKLPPWRATRAISRKHEKGCFKEWRGYSQSVENGRDIKDLEETNDLSCFRQEEEPGRS